MRARTSRGSYTFTTVSAEALLPARARGTRLCHAALSRGPPSTPPTPCLALDQHLHFGISLQTGLSQAGAR